MEREFDRVLRNALRIRILLCICALSSGTIVLYILYPSATTQICSNRTDFNNEKKRYEATSSSCTSPFNVIVANFWSLFASIICEAVRKVIPRHVQGISDAIPAAAAAIGVYLVSGGSTDIVFACAFCSSVAFEFAQTNATRLLAALLSVVTVLSPLVFSAAPFFVTRLVIALTFSAYISCKTAARCCFMREDSVSAIAAASQLTLFWQAEALALMLSGQDSSNSTARNILFVATSVPGTLLIIYVFIFVHPQAILVDAPPALFTENERVSKKKRSEEEKASRKKQKDKETKRRTSDLFFDV